MRVLFIYTTNERDTRSEERGCVVLKCVVLNNQYGNCDSKVNEVGV